MFKKGSKVIIKQGTHKFPLIGFKRGVEYTVKNEKYTGHSIESKSEKDYCVEILNEKGRTGYAPEEWLKLVSNLKNESEEL